MGYEGFISQSYHDEMYSLLDPNSHLLWNIFMICDQVSGTAAVSEIDACVHCETTDHAGFLVLGTWHPLLSCVRMCANPQPRST